MATDDEVADAVSDPAPGLLDLPLSRGNSSLRRSSNASVETVIVRSDLPSAQTSRSITPEDRVASFFTTMPQAFTAYDWESDGIPTKKFLDACRYGHGVDG
jgi:hypothetical protein